MTYIHFHTLVAIARKQKRYFLVLVMFNTVRVGYCYRLTHAPKGRAGTQNYQHSGSVRFNFMMDCFKLKRTQPELKKTEYHTHRRSSSMEYSWHTVVLPHPVAPTSNKGSKWLKHRPESRNSRRMCLQQWEGQKNKRNSRATPVPEGRRKPNQMSSLVARLGFVSVISPSALGVRDQASGTKDCEWSHPNTRKNVRIFHGLRQA